MTKVQLRDICQYNDGVGCTRYSWQRGDMCSRCGWCPTVFEARKRQTRKKLAEERGNITMGEKRQREQLKEALKLFQKMMQEQKSTGCNSFFSVN